MAIIVNSQVWRRQCKRSYNLDIVFSFVSEVYSMLAHKIINLHSSTIFLFIYPCIPLARVIITHDLDDPKLIFYYEQNKGSVLFSSKILISYVEIYWKVLPPPLILVKGLLNFDLRSLQLLHKNFRIFLRIVCGK